MAPLEELLPPPSREAAFARVRDITDLVKFWIGLEKKSVKRLTHPDDREALWRAVRESENSLAAVNAFLARPGHNEAVEAGRSLHLTITVWMMAGNRLRSRRTARRCAVWVDALSAWADVLEDVSPYSTDFDKEEGSWEDLTS